MVKNITLLTKRRSIRNDKKVFEFETFRISCSGTRGKEGAEKSKLRN